MMDPAENWLQRHGLAFSKHDRLMLSLGWKAATDELHSFYRVMHFLCWLRWDMTWPAPPQEWDA